jgi:hypothetical protein
MKRKDQSQALAHLLLFLTLTLPLQGCFKGCLSVEAGLNSATSKLLTTSVQEIKHIVAQLGESSSQILGTAGEQTRATMSEATTSIQRLLKSMEETTGGISKQIEGSVKGILDQVTTNAKQLLALSDQIVRSNIKCLDEVVAKRMQQLCDNIIQLIDKITTSINELVNNVFKNAQDFVKVGSSEVAILASKGFTMGLRAIILFFAMGLSIWLLRSNAKKEENRFNDYITPFNSITLLLIGGCMYLFLNPFLVWIFLGRASSVPFNKSDPQYQQICDISNVSYSNFIRAYNSNPKDENNLMTGLAVLDNLDKCAYYTEVNDISTRRKLMASKINAILFPPPSSPSVALAECNVAPSINPSEFSERKFAKIRIINDIYNVGEIKYRPVQNKYAVYQKALDSNPLQPKK